MQRLIKKRKGQSLVETALVLPVILLLLTAIIDFGLLFNHYLIVSNASREGARGASLGKTNEQIISTVKNAASTLDESKLSITITPNSLTDREAGTTVTVTVKYQYSMITPIIAAVIPGPFDLETNTAMRCE
jgi:Flp pilus assembly protein TadG